MIAISSIVANELLSVGGLFKMSTPTYDGLTSVETPSTSDGDCFNITTNEEECFTISVHEEECFFIKSNEEDEQEYPLPEDPIDFGELGFTNIKCVQAHGLFEIIVIGKYKPTESSPVLEVIANVNFIPSVIGGIGKLNGVYNFSELSKYDITYDDVTRLDGFDVLTTMSTLAIIVDTRVIWVEGMFFNVIGDTDEFDNVEGVPSENPFSKEETYPSIQQFPIGNRSGSFVYSGWWSSYYAPPYEDGQCLTGTLIGSPCGDPVGCGGVDVNTTDMSTDEIPKRKTYNISNGVATSDIEEPLFHETEAYGGGWMCEDTLRVPSFDLTYCSHEGTQVSKHGGGNVKMQREDIILVLGDGSVIFNTTFTKSAVSATYRGTSWGGGSGSCLCGDYKTYTWVCEIDTVTLNGKDNRLDVGFDTSKPIFKLSVTDDVVAGYNEEIGFVWAEKSGGRKGVESFSGGDVTVVDAIMLTADGSEKITQVNLLPTLLP